MRQLTAQDLPGELNDLLTCVLKPESVPKWLDNTESFPGSTPLEQLSIDEPGILEDRIRKIASGFYLAIGPASAPGVLPMEELIPIAKAKILAILQGRDLA